MGNPYLLTLLGDYYPSYDKAQKGQRISRHGPEKGAVNKRDTTVEKGDVVGEQAESGTRRDPL
mgnify:CR=1 FL=1